jgi:hypothetical protein
MDRERDLLIKQVFPRLRERFSERGIRLIDVDLRWGITDEAVADGAVLPTCLDEIERCHPFFIGLLGERYGYILDTLPAEALSLEPKLARLSRCSVTAIEVEYALSVPKSVSGVFFYFRDPKWVETLPAYERSICEETSLESIRRLGELKDRIRASGHPVHVNYRTPEEAASLIESDLGTLIDGLFPRDNLTGLLADSHRAFASERRKFWVGHDLDMKSTLSALESNPVVLITGERGTGISAFLSNCADAVRKRKPQMLVVEHYTQAHLEATTVESTCRQIISALANERALTIPTSMDDHEWPELLLEQLILAAQKGPILLVIDGADRLDRWTTGISADWLPVELPQGVSILASVDIDDAQYQTALTGWPVIHIDGLVDNDKKSFITEYLARYRKELDAPLTNKVLASAATSQPFYLLLLLQELRQHGSHDTLADRLSTLLEAKNADELSALVFTRCELDFCPEAALTENALRYLCIARLGLSDVELCELVGANGSRLPQRLWSPLRLALGQILVSSNGLLRFTRGSIKRTAEKRYMLSGKEEGRYRKQLLAYFASKPLTPRVVLEMSFQLSLLNAWEQLAECLKSPPFLVMFAETSPEELARAWARVEEHTHIKAATAYTPLQQRQLQPIILRLLRNLGHWTDAVSFCRLLAETALQGGDPKAALVIYLEIGQIELEAGSNVKAQMAFIDAYDLAKAVGTPVERLRCLQGQRRAKRLQLAQLGHSKSVVRAQISRELRILTAEIQRLAAASVDDPQLKLVAQTGQLQDIGASGIQLEHLQDVRRMFFSLIAGRDNESVNVRGIAHTLISQANTAAGRMQREHLETKEAIANLRLTRHRGLALLADAQLASFEGRHEELQEMLPVLARHGMSHDEPEMLAFVQGKYADCTIGEERLSYLERQAENLKRMGRRLELFFNLSEQVNVLRELGHKAKARLLLREMRGFSKTITLPLSRRFFFWFSGVDMTVDEWLTPTFWRFALWIVGPPWLYLMWQFEKWAGRWFRREPFSGSIILLASIPMLFAPAMMLLGEVTEATKKVMSWFQRPDKAGNRRDVETSPSHREGTAIQDKDCSPTAPLSDTNLITDDPTFAVLSRLSRLMLRLATVQRFKIRAHRIAMYLDLYNTRNSLIWMAVSFSVGVVLATCFWIGQGWWRVLFRSFGILGVVFLLEAAVTPVLLLLRHRRLTASSLLLREMERNASRTLGMVALIRLKRRIFGKRGRC